MRMTIERSIFCLLVAWAPMMAHAEQLLEYRLQYAASGDCCVRVQIDFPEPLKAPVSLVIPRTYPGGYEQILYDAFVENVVALTPQGKALTVTRETDGPRWKIGTENDLLAGISYRVNIQRMEDRIVSAVETSKVRRGYAGLLGYSIFSYVDDTENRRIKLHIEAPSGWPVLTTLAAQAPAPLTEASAEAPDYYTLADSQVLLGPDIQIRRLAGKVPLILAIYAETSEDIALEGQLAREALDRVADYFGDPPLPRYTVQLELLRPAHGHEYDFSQEHIDSGTFSFSVDRALSGNVPQQQLSNILFNYAHHMAHSWIPKQAYGIGYRPFTWELAPVMDTIWFNEGFARYAAIAALTNGLPQEERFAFRQAQLLRLRRILNEAPPFIRKMPLDVLSREASFLYAVDFRTGKNVFARGALMAAEMDDFFISTSGGKRSLRDAIHALLAWSQKNRRPFEVNEMMQIFSESTGCDAREIFKRWMEPMTP